MNAPVNKEQSRIQGMFASIAPWYDFLNHLLSLNADQRWRRRMARALLPKTPGLVLDVCTGTGDLAIAFQKHWANQGRVIGSDFCRPMLERADAKARKKNIPLAWINADTLCLPFPDNQFDLVAVAFGLRNVSDTRSGVEEMLRVAKPGGTVAILEFSRPRNWFLGPIYSFYFRQVMPRLGQFFSKSPDEAYSYLRNSVLNFPAGPDLVSLLEQWGLQSVRFTPMSFGVVTLYHGTKLSAVDRLPTSPPHPALEQK
ncbi:MAG: bifunctional demethylmenaquinone methyltransferase/2-methoxy-6-polyprenyl-1,4-benzoquinol methylase UbiE [Gemmataceae bacterium]|nr:bifunctional demethylmenaquinone methyltransferase/2-methoxy-6-polyprenyl-1,4-benzoquinol methylase UbiE [Gemmataceae bacterium]